jgi:hypothetical protein
MTLSKLFHSTFVFLYGGSGPHPRYQYMFSHRLLQLSKLTKYCNIALIANFFQNQSA